MKCSAARHIQCGQDFPPLWLLQGAAQDGACLHSLTDWGGVPGTPPLPTELLARTESAGGVMSPPGSSGQF